MWKNIKTKASPYGSFTTAKTFWITIQFLLFNISIVVGSTGSVTETLNFTYTANYYKNVSIETLDKPAFYAPRYGYDVALKCIAPFPIEWKFKGHLYPPEVVYLPPLKRNLATKTFDISAFILFGGTRELYDVGASVEVTCQKVGNSSVSDGLFVFTRGNSNESLILPKNTTVTDSVLIPCPTKNPTVATNLYRKNAKGIEEPVSNDQVKYYPTEGFRSTGGFFDGLYVCRQNASVVTVTAVLSPPPSNSYIITPDSSEIRAFSEDTIQLECASKFGLPVYMVVENIASDGVTITISNTTQGAKVNISGRLQVAGSDGNNVNVTGRVACLAKTTHGTILIKEWFYEFVETPELYLDNYSGETYCMSKVSPKTIQTVWCKNGIQCDLFTDCLENVTRCNFRQRKQFAATEDGRMCLIDGVLRECTPLLYSHLSGLAQCNVSGLIKRWDFFTSLDFLKYSNWRLVPERELLRMDEVLPVLYTNKTEQFFCSAVSYLFADSLSFELEFTNGSRLLLEHNGDSVNISNPKRESSRRIRDFNIIGILDIRLPLEAVGIHCIAPWWNDTAQMETARNFDTRHLVHPRFVDEGDTDELITTRANSEGDDGSVQLETLYTGQTNRRLMCNATGEPQPNYQWFFENRNVSDIFQELRTSSGSNGEGYLEFPTIDASSKMYKGVYECLAENTVGKVRKSFRLDVADEPISGATVIYVGLFALVVIILAVVLLALVTFMRRYKRAQELVRSLTDAEVEEFFQGKPELLANATSWNNGDMVHFLPYRSEYEIPLNDLEFGIFVRKQSAWRRSLFIRRCRKDHVNRKRVALKISKTSADVEVFKSLLSEVKILIYVGIHENIAALVGVCTQGIRNRCIYIASEICELGSLEKYLRKARNTFLDLINANQIIDPDLLKKFTSDQLTTLDLICFSEQIAKGMEYLTYKSVIHADLAARNVLLSAGKIAKISDFGLSKKLYECNNYVKKTQTPLPWRWMAIESLTTLTFSTSSDIWSYGTTLFEIFSLGDIPFPNEEYSTEFINRLSGGMRMGRPDFSTPEIYSLIGTCWEKNPDLRPSFTAVRTVFENMRTRYAVNKLGDNTSLYEEGPVEEANKYVNVVGTNATQTCQYINNLDPTI